MYVIIDIQYPNEPSTASQFNNFVNGWTAGVMSVSIPYATLTPGFYVDQYDYQTFNLSSLSQYAFIAVNPIVNNAPYVLGSSIEGWIAYYAYCDSSDGSASKYVQQVNSWQPYGFDNTVQFSDSGVDCGPS